jgi:predicted GTPase
MEILTHGKGESIGKEAQRTTRDVRTYTYKNLQITDVPGIAAFEGEDDENIAFDAAKKCDLILFLITDDAPQACEAECLNRILELGKPVICLITQQSVIQMTKLFSLWSNEKGETRGARS